MVWLLPMVISSRFASSFKNTTTCQRREHARCKLSSHQDSEGRGAEPQKMGKPQRAPTADAFRLKFGENFSSHLVTSVVWAV